jgi:glyoxylase-like metal-dependent hydrolase (beta-lactamase superfamily II)
MIRRLFLPGLLDTGTVCGRLMAIRDGFVNLFVVSAPGGLVCFDAGFRQARVARGFQSLGLNPRDVAAVFLTHSHWDHAVGAGLFPNAEVFIGEHEPPSLSMKLKRLERPRPWKRVRDEQTVNAAGLSARVLHTPGHTAGSVSYLVENRFLFSGDAFRLRRGEAVPFLRCFSRDMPAMIRSIQKLASIEGIEWLLTGHSGAAGDPAKAFRRWRETATEPPRREAHGP